MVMKPRMVCCYFFFFLMIRRPPRSTLFPTRRSSDLAARVGADELVRHLLLHDVDEHLPGAMHRDDVVGVDLLQGGHGDRKSTRLNSSHSQISYAVFCLKKKNQSHLYSLIHHLLVVHI